jgi:hypothetical protein
LRRIGTRGALAALTLSLARGVAVIAPFSIAVLASSPALAQTGQGVVTGTVTDAQSKRAVANVVVTVTSPALQGEEIVVTDAAGNYRVSNLPPGDYSVNLQGDGFRAFGRGGIKIQGGATIRFNVSLIPDSVKAEEVVVVGKAPTVDVGSSSTGATLDREFLSRIPLSRPTGKGGAVRSFESVAEVAPGAANDSYGVGIAGTTSPENRYNVDRLAVNDPAYGIVGSPLSVEFIQEVSVITGGFMPEYGRSTGGVINVAHQERQQRVPRLGLRQHHPRHPRGRARGREARRQHHRHRHRALAASAASASTSAVRSSRTSSGSTAA